ncbi:MAG: dgk [Burkholderiales bacterium]|nr:dgk [Burkholderiales bacterium]
MDKLRHVVVEGPIGAGKTSLARRLAARLGADLILFQRARLLEPLAQPDMFARPVVADFLLDKDPLFARITLSADELALYDRIYEALRLRTPAPDLVIYLQAQPAVLIERVRRRAVRYEGEIGEDYLARLAEAYSRFFYHYDAAPLLIVNSENLNFVERDPDFELLVSRLRAMRSRREFFNVG